MLSESLLNECPVHFSDIISCVPWRQSALLREAQRSQGLSLFITCIEYLKRRLRFQTAHKKRGHQDAGSRSFSSETAAWGGNPLPGKRRHSATLGTEPAREGAGSSLIAVFPPSSLPGEFSREKPGEDGRPLFFGVKQWRRLRRWRRGFWCRGHLNSSSPQRARVPSCLGESRLFFLREMRLSRARGRSGSSCCAGVSWPPL